MTASRRWLWLWLAVATSLLVGVSAHAASIDVIGTAGAQGTPSSPGPPPVDGGPGGDGDQAVAISDSLDPSNSASATGGDGGDGGGVVQTFGAVTENAGSGGAGGDAAAYASVDAVDAASATASALGGSGGSGGYPSPGTSLAPHGAPGDGARGGDATATANAVSDSSSATVSASASGGDGGAASIANDNSTIPYTYYSAVGGDGGTAHVAATSRGTGAVSVDASAIGGDGGLGATAGAAGGIDVGAVSGISDGAGTVIVSLSATGGAGGSSGIGESNADGADVFLLDSVWGETTGSLRLVQRATGGNAGGAGAFPSYASALPAAGGDASSALSRVANASMLEVVLSATGGSGSLLSAGAAPGGSASISGDGSNDAGSVSIGGIARGGGGGGTGAGGAASASFHASSVGDGHAVSIGTVSGGTAAVGGDGDLLAARSAPGSYGLGGDATSSSVGEAFGESDVVVIDTAIGGDGGSVSGPVSGSGHDGSKGGDASSSARAITHGGASARAESYALGGDGGEGGNDGAGQGTNLGGASGSARAQAYASSDYGAVSVRVSQRAGATGGGPGGAPPALDSVLEDAADGDTLGTLSLQQSAYGGANYPSGSYGTGASSAAGAAVSRLSKDRFAGGDLDLYASAQGGYSQTGAGGSGSVDVVGVDRSGARLTVGALALGGIGGTDAGEASLRASGRSYAGGDVIVSGMAHGGDGRTGAAVHLLDAVSGDTSGVLSLEQNAYGGRGSIVGGGATSRLTHDGDSTSIDVSVLALGDGRSSVTCCGTLSGVLLAAPTADAFARVRNHSGSVAVRAEAEGGAGSNHVGLSSTEFAAGADADSEALGETDGDGHAVNVVAVSQGGRGSSPISSLVDGHAGGDASTTSRGTAFGDSSVDVRASAGGGDGGSVSSNRAGGLGGDAVASAIAEGAGASRVFALATASAGSTGSRYNYPYSPPSSKGAAAATASATGLRNAASRAEALSEENMSATSRATLVGGHVRNVEVLRNASAQTYGYHAYTAVESSFGETLTLQQALAKTSTGVDQQSSLAFGLPDEAAGATWIASDPRIQAAVANQGELLGLGLIAGSSFVRHSSSVISFAIDTSSLASDESLFFGMLGVDSTGLGFSALRVQLEAGGNTLFDESFGDVAAANASLDDLIVPTSVDGSSGNTLVELLIRIDLEFAPYNLSSDTAKLGFAVFAGSPVPEPSRLVLLASLVVACAVARARRGVSSRSP